MRDVHARRERERGPGRKRSKILPVAEVCVMLVNGSDGRAAWALAVLKVAPGQKIRCSLQGSSWFYFGSHWLGRVFLCSGDGCPGCVHGPGRVMGYRVALVESGDRWRPVLLELSSGAISGLRGFCEIDAVVDVSGLVVELFRRQKRSPIKVEPVGMGGVVADRCQSAAVVINAVAVLYGLPLMLDGELPTEWSCRVKPVAEAQLAAAVVMGR